MDERETRTRISKMRRSSMMTLGFVLILIGIQLHVVESYELTPRISNFLSENGGSLTSDDPLMAFQNQAHDSPYYQASSRKVTQDFPKANLASGGVKTIRTPRWLCWPVLFLGAVIFLNGVGRRRD